MFIKNFKCSKCKNDTLEPNFDLTIDSYIKNDFNLETIISVELEKPLKRPGYIIFQCVNRECNNTIKLTEKEILEQLLEEWSNIGWQMAQYYINSCTDFEGYKTRYLYDDTTQKFLFNKEPNTTTSIQEVYKDYLNYKKNEQKRIK